MKPTIPAIQTRYAGCHFRSRTEARWAVFFDACGVKWEYEKEGYDLSECNDSTNDMQLGRYLPDFWLPERKAWVEIKGCVPEDHFKPTLPECQIWALVFITSADMGYVFFGNPDINVPCSVVHHYHNEHDPYPERASREFATVVDIVPARMSLNQSHFDAAKSARFEFGARGR